MEIIQLVPLERIKNQIVEHIVGVLVPQIKEDIVQNLVGEQIVDVPVPQIQDDGMQLVSTQEQIMDFLVWKLCILHHKSACRIIRWSR